MRRASSLSLLVVCLLGASVARAESSVLIAASDPAQIAEVEVAKVMATDAPLWLSVKLSGGAKIAIVSSAASVEPANAADSWLRALDFSTRTRVLPPRGPLAGCTDLTGQPADSGFPELPSVSSSEESSLVSEVDLRRSLADAAIAADLTAVADFSAHVAPPFRFALYQSAASGGATAAFRLSTAGQALTVPGIVTSGRASVPLTLLALASTAALPDSGLVSDPSELAVSYLGATASTNYGAARVAWLNEDPSRWLLEARASTALFAWTEVSAAGEVEPATRHYFDAAAGSSAGPTCFSVALDARARASHVASDFDCGNADDLGRSLSSFDFGDLVLTRLFGSIGAAGVALHSVNESAQDALIVATDFDSTNCPASQGVTPVTVGGSTPGVVSTPTAGSGSTASVASTDGTTSVQDGSGNVTVVTDSCSGDSSSGDSCSGDSSSDSNGSSDSCSGDSSSSKDSCSGSSASSDASDSSDSCSGDSSSSSDDSSGCGKSNYDGDTCSGNSANSASAAGKNAAALQTSQSKRGHRPRQVHLSLFTLLAASIALPLRRKKLAARLFNS